MLMVGRTGTLVIQWQYQFDLAIMEIIQYTSMCSYYVTDKTSELFSGVLINSRYPMKFLIDNCLYLSLRQTQFDGILALLIFINHM